MMCGQETGAVALPRRAHCTSWAAAARAHRATALQGVRQDAHRAAAGARAALALRLEVLDAVCGAAGKAKARIVAAAGEVSLVESLLVVVLLPTTHILADPDEECCSGVFGANELAKRPKHAMAVCDAQAAEARAVISESVLPRPEGRPCGRTSM